MKMNIRVTLTFEQVEALTTLGMTQFQARLDEYQEVEHRVRTNLCNISSRVRYVAKHPAYDEITYFQNIVDLCAELFNNKQIHVYYWNDNFKQLQLLNSIKERAEFIVKHRGEPAHLELMTKYQQEMDEACEEFIKVLNDKTAL